MHMRKAIIGDIKDIHRLLNHYADQGLLLPRSLSELYDHLRDYFVLAADDNSNSIHGVCGLRICWEDLAEIKSLAISEDQQGKGSGIRLVETCLEDSRSLGLKRCLPSPMCPTFL